MDINLIVVDNFLEYPDSVRESGILGLKQIHTKNLKFYPGVRSEKADEEYQNYIKNKFEKILNVKITQWDSNITRWTGEEVETDSSCFQLCTEDAKTWIHVDPCEWTAILYLSPNPVIDSGTAIYKHKTTNKFKMTEQECANSEGDWDIINFVGNVYNRCILMKGNLCHRSLIPGFGNDIESGRLTQVFFFNT